MSTADALAAIEEASSNGTFFCVDFIKRTDNLFRSMVCRRGVVPKNPGQQPRFNPAAHDLIVVWDAHKRAYRHIPLDRIVQIRGKGRVIYSNAE